MNEEVKNPWAHIGIVGPFSVANGQSMTITQSEGNSITLVRESAGNCVRIRFPDDEAGRLSAAREAARHAVMDEDDERQDVFQRWFDSCRTGEPDAVDSQLLLWYQYRDAHNFKTSRAIRFDGEISPDDVRLFLLMLDDSEGDLDLIPGACGLPDLQDSFSGCESMWDPERDHPFCSLTEFKRVAADEESGADVEERSFAEFVADVHRHVCEHKGWDQNYKPDCYPVMARRYEQYALSVAGEADEGEADMAAPLQSP